MITILCSGSRGDYQPYIALVKAGIPSIIVPFSNDQFAWAHRSYDLGIGAKPIPKKELSADKLAEAISFALTDKIISNAEVLSERVATENGVAECAKIIIKCLEG
jgi:sterol 3beta-glucosyltransferase